MALAEALSDEDDATDGFAQENWSNVPEMHSMQYLEIGEEDVTEFVPKRSRKPPSGPRTQHLPASLEGPLALLIEWSRGPARPQIQKIRTIYTPLEHISQRIRKSLAERRIEKVSFAALLLLWSTVIFLGVWRSLTPPSIDRYGTAKPIKCMQQAWSVRDDCGLNGVDCGPFNNTTTAYLCHPDCASKEVFEPHVVGDQEVIYTPLVIGGAQNILLKRVYRADSSICQAAIHAGVLKNGYGGVVVLKLIGSHANFPATLSNGIQSVGFDSSFPKAFVFETLDDTVNKRPDLRWSLLVVSVAFTSTVSIFVSSTPAFFASVYTMIFVHVALISDKPELPTMAALVSLCAGRFLPAAFIAVVVYQTCVRTQLHGLNNAPFERTLLWLGGAWFGALENYTLDHLPIRRLTPHDLQSQAGAVLTLLLLVIIISAIAVGQIYYLRLEGRLRRYLKLYACLAGALSFLAFQPWLHLRIHHYVLALLLLPGTAIQTRPSLLYQGLLIGLFINGVARWGLDSILQTDDALRGEDGRYGSPLPIVTASPGPTAIGFQWASPPSPYDGVSVLINDVECYRWYIGQGASDYTYSRKHDPQSKMYFRFAYRTDGHAVDYTKAGIWELDGSWTDSGHG